MTLIKTSYQLMEENYKKIRKWIFARRFLFIITLVFAIGGSTLIALTKRTNSLHFACIYAITLCFYSFLSALATEFELKALWKERNQIAGRKAPPFDYHTVVELLQS